MKHVPRLGEEPEQLKTYRAAYPEDAKAKGEDAKRVWNRFRDDPAYKDLRDQLVARQQGLCGYCEQRLTRKDGALITTDQQVEHVCAKSGGDERTLDWTNLMLCCSGGTNPHHDDPSRKKASASESCGQSKLARELGKGCDPRDFPLLKGLVRVGIDGRLFADIANCFEAGVNPTVLDETLNDVLQLNCERLRMAREKTRACVAGENLWLTEQLLSRGNYNAAQKQALIDLVVAGRLQPDPHGHLNAFWTTERQALEPWSDDWLSRNEAAFL